jgi:hypothetical protein
LPVRARGLSERARADLRVQTGAEHAQAPIRAIAPPIADVVRLIPHVAPQACSAGAPHGRHYYWKSHQYPTFPDALIDVFKDRIGCVTAPFFQINGWAVGGAVTRVAADATAVGERHLGFDLNIVAAWPPPDPNRDEHIECVREGGQQVQPFCAGVYANFVNDEGNAGTARTYGDRLGRLTELKNKWDPTNFFHLNANIPPNGGPR